MVKEQKKNATKIALKCTKQCTRCELSPIPSSDTQTRTRNNKDSHADDQ